MYHNHTLLYLGIKYLAQFTYYWFSKQSFPFCYSCMLCLEYFSEKQARKKCYLGGKCLNCFCWKESIRNRSHLKSCRQYTFYERKDNLFLYIYLLLMVKEPRMKWWTIDYSPSVFGIFMYKFVFYQNVSYWIKFLTVWVFILNFYEHLYT